MTDITATNTADAVLELLDREGCAINMTGLIQLLPDHPELEVKRLTNDLYMRRRLARVQVMGAAGRYYVYYSLQIRPVRGQPAPPVDQAPADSVPLSPDEAVEVLERAGWKAEPEVIEPIEPAAPIQVERRLADRRRLTSLDVIKHWRLAYPLARVVEIIGQSRRRGVSRDDAALAIKMLREHVREDEG